jgi:hypothetical protein
VAAGLAGVGVPVVAELPADLDLVPRDAAVLHPLAEQDLGAAVAIGVAVVEERDALVERERAEAVAVFLGAVAPPVDAEDPAPEADGRHVQCGVPEGPTLHDGR